MTEAQEKSELQTLLEKNVSWFGLSKFEFGRAAELIETGENTEKVCWICSGFAGEKHKSIYDTGLCKGHAMRALCSRK
jgi:hypothetical protein